MNETSRKEVGGTQLSSVYPFQGGVMFLVLSSNRAWKCMSFRFVEYAQNGTVSPRDVLHEGNLQ